MATSSSGWPRYDPRIEGNKPGSCIPPKMGICGMDEAISSGRMPQRNNRKSGHECPPCEEYRRYFRCLEKTAADMGLKGMVKHPIFPRTQHYDEPLELEPLEVTPERFSAIDGVIEELGELPILTLHRLAQRKEEASGKFYPEERGLARVCNPIGSSYLTARPFRCTPIYRFCEPVNGGYTGHVPGEAFVIGEHRGKATRNALKYMTFRV